MTGETAAQTAEVLHGVATYCRVPPRGWRGKGRPSRWGPDARLDPC